ncbi:hypothetical protein Fcan01_08689 [Folsomia candida]|uniref:Uncharacterized protein n=1 Tax=Folsomia candida TaxID=158441 RepID=A0A226EDW4_FOLCA|nr:hypothetical protein Fcan01_08689 [Folsomia candida]
MGPGLGVGLIFLVDVTGIKSRGRFLKGWFHLKVTLEIDHNYWEGRKVPETEDDREKEIDALRKRHILDKLMVTARGRILTSGRPTGNYGHVPSEPGPARRAWVGGIGQFVQDFPSCADYTSTEYVTQQYMPCGSVQGGEAMYGNNFYYSRTKDEKKANGVAIDTHGWLDPAYTPYVVMGQVSGSI